jgi:hypothetical protein
VENHDWSRSGYGGQRYNAQVRGKGELALVPPLRTERIIVFV